MIKNFLGHCTMIRQGIHLLIKIEKKYVILHLFSCLLTPLLPYVNIYYMAQIINELAGSKNPNLLFSYIFTTILITILLVLLINALNYMKQSHLDQFYKNEKMLFSEKTMTMDFNQLESNFIRMLFERIQIESQSGHNAYFLYTFLGKSVSNLVSAITAIVISYDIFSIQINIILKLCAIIIIFIVILINAFSNYKTNLHMLKYYDMCVKFSARLNFYYNYFQNYKTGKDVRLYNMEDYILNLQRQDDACNNDLVAKTKIRCLKYVLVNHVMIDILSIAAYIFFTIICYNGQISVGNITKYVFCLLLLVNAASEMILQLQSLIDNNKYLKNYFEYINIPSAMNEGILPVDFKNISEIVFEDVSFQYPGSEKYALKNFSFHFVKGKRVAIVGLNGSGKTTMIKLMCRLYNPTSGKIYLNGKDIRCYDYAQYLNLFGVIFQDFRLFSFSLAQNIAANAIFDEDQVRQALSKAGLNEWNAALPKGIHTSLYKDFEEDGVEISGGEAQKIAIARAIYKEADFIILDEPTAALDPIAEAEVYTQLDQLFEDKLVVFISHRLSSCLFCDDIIVLHDGELVQRGDHQTLLSNEKGNYYQLWRSQAQHYRENS